MAYHLSKDMPRAKFMIGDIVAEKCISAKKIVPFRVTQIQHPKADKKGRIYDSYYYYLETALPDDGDHFLHGKFFPEGLLVPFNHQMKEHLLGALADRMEDINELVDG